MLLSIIYLIAISAEAMTGALSAGRRRMDLFGVVMIACVTALGGGSLRDILLGHYPLGWVKHPEYLGFTVCAALIATWVARWIPLPPHLPGARWPGPDRLHPDRLLDRARSRPCDADRADRRHADRRVRRRLRDILCNEVPLIFRRSCAIIALLTGAAYLLLLHWGVADATAILCCLGGGFALRLLAIHYRWECRSSLPRRSAAEVRAAASAPPRRCTWRCRSCAAPGASPVQMGRSPTPTGPDRGRTRRRWPPSTHAALRRLGSGFINARGAPRP
jgi:uncharacterized membrane protein YeiH